MLDHICYKKVVEFEPHWLQRAFHSPGNKILGGRASGKYYVAAMEAKLFYPNKQIVVPGIKMLDALVHFGIKPSRITLLSELKMQQVRSFTEYSICTREDIDNGGNPCT